MGNRVYRFFFGCMLLLSLYFDLKPVMYGLIVSALFEGITNLGVARLIGRRRSEPGGGACADSLDISFNVRRRFEAERGWRLLIATMLLVSLFVFPDTLWYFPWFMGFAITGAGLSGVCPMFLMLKWAGLR